MGEVVFCCPKPPLVSSIPLPPPPTHTKTHALPRRGKYTPSTHDPAILCALCGFEALLITPEPEEQPGRRQEQDRGPPRPYSICPWCFNHPPDFSHVDDEFRSVCPNDLCVV